LAATATSDVKGDDPRKRRILHPTRLNRRRLDPLHTPMHTNFDPDSAARMLAETWRGGQQLTELPSAIRPRTIDEGYDTQDQLLRLLGAHTVGWKLGVGSPKALRAANLARPMIGQVIETERYDSGAAVRIASATPVTVEFEIAYVLARDIAPGSAPAVPMDAVGETRVSFELVHSRFVDRRAVGWPSFAADDSAFRALIVGEILSPGAADSLADSIVVCAGDRVAGRGLTGDDRTDPVASLAALFAHAAERNITLRRGQVVSTGAVAQPFENSDPAIVIAARYGSSQLQVRIERAGR
jgi:2-keto-4-pentenoate hydratase